MNRLSFSNGGFPLTLNDLDFQFAAFQESLENILKFFGDKIIMNGCVFSDNSTQYKLTSGYVIIDSELFLVEPQIVEKNGLLKENFGLVISEVYSGIKQLADGGTHNARLVRKAVLSQNPTTSTILLTEIESKRIDVLMNPVSNIAFSFESGVTGVFFGGNFSIKRMHKLIKFSGMVSFTQTDPDGFRIINNLTMKPEQDLTFICKTDSNLYPLAFVTVQANSGINVQVNSNLNSAVVVDLSPVSYFIN